MKTFRIDYKWKEITNAWKHNYHFVKAETKEDAIKIYKESFDNRIEIKIKEVTEC
jgi:hypothetical protein